MRIVVAVSTLVSLATARPASSQAIPIRTLEPASAHTIVPVRANWGMVQLPGSRLLVNDGTAHRLYLFDATLATSTVLRDSVPGQANSYGARSGMLIPYFGDSSLFSDNVSLTLNVVDAGGMFRRVMTPPKAADLRYLGTASRADSKAHLIYKGADPPKRTPKIRGKSCDCPRAAQSPDSAAAESCT